MLHHCGLLRGVTQALASSVGLDSKRGIKGVHTFSSSIQEAEEVGSLEV